MLDKMLKLRNKKGFTLMEMLIVVAIIAILIAIAIPTFNNSLNKARVATDEANIRSGYTAVAATVLTDPTEDTTAVTYTLNADGSATTPATTAYTCQGTVKDGQTISISGTAAIKWAKGNTITYTYTPTTGAIAINVK